MTCDKDETALVCIPSPTPPSHKVATSLHLPSQIYHHFIRMSIETKPDPYLEIHRDHFRLPLELKKKKIAVWGTSGFVGVDGTGCERQASL